MITTYRNALAVLGVAIFFTNFSGFTHRYGVITLAWMVMYIGLCFPLVVHGAFKGRIPIRPVVWWVVGYIVISILWFYRTPGDAFSYQQVQTRILYSLFLVVTLVVFATRDAQRAGRIAIIWAVLLGTALNLYELFNPLTFSTVPGRSVGLYYNINHSSAALALGLALSLGLVRPKLRGLFMLVALVGIIPTFSRGGILAWMLIVAYHLLRDGISFAQVRRVALVAVGVLALVSSPLWTDLSRTLEERGVLTLNVRERIAFLTGGGVRDASTSERQELAGIAWELFAEEPLLGHGTGSSLLLEGYGLGPHNIYLVMLAEHGVIGFFIIPALFFAVLYGANRKTMDVTIPITISLLLYGIFSHTVLDEVHVMLSLGLVASMVASERVRKTHPVPAPPATLPALAGAKA